MLLSLRTIERKRERRKKSQSENVKYLSSLSSLFSSPFPPPLFRSSSLNNSRNQLLNKNTHKNESISFDYLNWVFFFFLFILFVSLLLSSYFVWNKQVLSSLSRLHFKQKTDVNIYPNKQIQQRSTSTFFFFRLHYCLTLFLYPRFNWMFASLIISSSLAVVFLLLMLMCMLFRKHYNQFSLAAWTFHIPPFKKPFLIINFPFPLLINLWKGKRKLFFFSFILLFFGDAMLKDLMESRMVVLCSVKLSLNSFFLLSLFLFFIHSFILLYVIKIKVNFSFTSKDGKKKTQNKEWKEIENEERKFEVNISCCFMLPSYLHYLKASKRCSRDFFHNKLKDRM